MDKITRAMLANDIINGPKSPEQAEGLLDKIIAEVEREGLPKLSLTPLPDMTELVIPKPIKVARSPSRSRRRANR